MHLSQTTISREFLDLRFGALGGWQARGQFGDDMPQAMNLLLPHDMAVRPACVLDILMAVQHVRDRVGIGTVGTPEMHGENQSAAAGIVIEHCFDGGVRQDAAVPIEFVVDQHRRKRGRERSGRQHMTRVERHVPAVEIVHFRSPDICRADGQTAGATIDPLEVDKVRQCAP